jgi:endogenous inhibitor of DNA gyrase (YacG/DUF329 family)
VTASPTTTNETHRCPYCHWVFEVTPRHRSEKVYPFCSHGCSIAVVEKHVAFEEHHCELREEITAGEMPAEYEPDLSPIADLPGEIEERLRAFFVEWTRIPENTRVCIALRLRGIPFWTIGELQGISKQAAFKAARKAAMRSPVLAAALAMDLKAPAVDRLASGAKQECFSL